MGGSASTGNVTAVAENPGHRSGADHRGPPPVAQDMDAHSPDPWQTTEVVLPLETAQAAQAFTEVVEAYAA